MKIELLVESSLDLSRIYLLNRVADTWRESGHEVGVRTLDEPAGRADLSILHVDRSRIPASAVEPHLQAGHPVLNARALDITKRRVSEILLTPEDDWGGPVIIKTDLNYWGQPERRRDGPPSLAVRALARLQKALPWRIGRRLPVESYPVLDGMDEVPAWLWRSRKYVVERFVPEREGDLYVTRYWVFLGEREFVCSKWTRGYIVKRNEEVRREFTDQVPEALRERRVELGFDYGKFDWVWVDGRPVIFDANKTPALHTMTGSRPHLLEQLAGGIEGWSPAGCTVGRPAEGATVHAPSDAAAEAGDSTG